MGPNSPPTVSVGGFELTAQWLVGGRPQSSTNSGCRSLRGPCPWVSIILFAFLIGSGVIFINALEVRIHYQSARCGEEIPLRAFCAFPRQWPHRFPFYSCSPRGMVISANTYLRGQHLLVSLLHPLQPKGWLTPDMTWLPQAVTSSLY